MNSTTPLLASVPNFRDLGGYPTSCGRSVRRRLLYRSEDFSNLTPEDEDSLHRLGIRSICDLRSDRECQLNPGIRQASTSVDILHMNISADLRASHETITRLLSGAPTREHAERAMLETYRIFPGMFANSLPLLFERILDHRRLPMIIHCAAGKDRTGFVVAILLHALGVPQTAIYEDYLLSAKRWNGDRSERAIRNYLAPLCEDEPSRDVIRTLCGVEPRYLHAAFEVIDLHYGGIEGYLKLNALDANAQNRLRELLLE